MPQTAVDDTRAQTGTVLAVGPKTRDVTAGDRLLFRRWGGTEVRADGEGLLLLEPRDVYAVID
jgi:chaperonin GroES